MNEKALVSTEKIVIAFILFYLSFRLLVDFTYIDDKPGYAKVGFILLSLLLIAYNVGKLVNKTDIVLFALISLMIFYPLAFSQENFAAQLVYNLKILLIPLVLLSCSHLDISFEKLRRWAQIVMLVALVIALVLFFSGYTFNLFELYTLFDNNPVHTVSQSTAKLSFLFLYSKVYFGFFTLAILIILNVRSNLLPILAIFLYRNLQTYYKYIVFVLLLLVGLLLLASSIDSSFISFEDIVNRFINKNRMDGYAGEGIKNISSGRTVIWSFYINYIEDNYTFINYLFGTGSLEVQGKYPLNAHNDFLNVIINFGIVGAVILVLLSIEIYKRLHPKYRNYVAFYFMFVFLTNGIMFHQSNILFLLYLRGTNQDGSNQENMT
ncbi:MAG: O-antigen ligase family protein [Thiotrichaceae bacterium]